MRFDREGRFQTGRVDSRIRYGRSKNVTDRAVRIPNAGIPADSAACGRHRTRDAANGRSFPPRGPKRAARAVPPSNRGRVERLSCDAVANVGRCGVDSAARPAAAGVCGSASGAPRGMAAPGRGRGWRGCRVHSQDRACTATLCRGRRGNAGVTDSKRRVRPVCTVVWQGSAATAAPMPIKRGYRWYL
jgi:hypothetical protein